MRSKQFDDIYFSVEDGLAETRHTFLMGNGLPGAWVGRERFCVCETGFGTGLNILAVWRLFEETAKAGQRLDLVSVEKYPLSREEIRTALAQWDLQPELDRLLELYPLRVPGFHRLNLSNRVTLTLIFDDVLNALPQLSGNVDAWFLDGFAPAKNPDMWSAALYGQMARLSHDGTTAATFTAAGDVRRGLAAAGFAVEKARGYGRKRDMIVARFSGAPRVQKKSPGRVTIIGAGLAGLSAAWHLKREGVDVVVYDAQGIATGASGNSRGIINPKLNVNGGPQAAYYTAAYDYALRFIGGGGHGSLHLEMDADKARRFAGYQRLGWHGDHMRYLSAREASDVAGVAIDKPGLFYPDATATSPRDLCLRLAEGIEVVTQTIAKPEGEVIILANANGIKDLCDLPIGPVRGQVSMLAAGDVSVRLKTNVCYGGYITPASGGMHMCGATFQPWDDDPTVRDADHLRNVDMLGQAIPALSGMTVTGGWTGFRAASKDRFPIVGAYGGQFVNVAHGSHGLISGLMAGAVLAADIAGGPPPLGMDTIMAVSPARFAG